MMRDRLETCWRRCWLKVPLRTRMPIRDGALWLSYRLCDLATWLDCMTVGSTAEAIEAMEKMGLMLRDEGIEWEDKP